MTIYEHLLLRHTVTDPKNFLHYLYRVLFFTLHPITAFAHFIDFLLPDPARKQFERLIPRFINWRHARELRERAEKLLESYGFDPKSILDSVPKDLSAGAKSIAKLVAAQLYQNIRVLILDEAFANLQRDVWPFLVDSLRDWALSSNVAILVISHSDSELLRWQPNIRFVIQRTQEDGRDIGVLVEVGAAGVTMRHGVPSRNQSFPVFEHQPKLKPAHIPYVDLWSYVGLVQGFVFLVLEPLKDIPATQNLLNSISGAPVHALSINIVEGDDCTSLYKKYAADILKLCPTENFALVAIGGGLCLNFVGFLASTLHRGQMPTILVPTTLLAMADVAVGSKTSINLGLGSDADIPAPLNVKHTVGTYHNPKAVLLDKRYLEKLPDAEIKVGLVECLKHGLLQDSKLFEHVAALMTQSTTVRAEAYDVATQTLALKSDTLEIDPWETKYGRILLYGHLHAHAIERATKMSVSHGVAVLLGMILEARLTSNSSIENALCAIVAQWGIPVASEFMTFDLAVMEKIYRSSNKAIFRQDDGFKVLSVGDIGKFGLQRIRDSIAREHRLGHVDFDDFANQQVSQNEMTVGWTEIRASYGAIRERLRALAPSIAAT